MENLSLFLTKLTPILAVWGAALSTVLGLIKYLEFRRDRPHIIVTVKGNYRILPRNTIYGDHLYVCISAANKGRRPVTLSNAALLMPRKYKDKYLVCVDRWRAVTAVEVREGQKRDYLARQDDIPFPSNKYVACVSDVTGRHYWSHNFIMRFIKLHRIK